MKTIMLAWCLLVLAAVEGIADSFDGKVSVTQTNGMTWSYTVFNDQPTGDPNFIYSFEVAVDAPVQVITSPPNWTFDTDNATYVYWYDTDSAPYPDDIAPGASLGGFVISATDATSALLGYTLDAWNHPLDQPGLSADGTALGPSLLLSQSPEPATGAMVSIFLIVFGVSRRRKVVALTQRPDRSKPQMEGRSGH